MVSGIGYFLFFLVAFLTLTILLVWPVFPYIVLAIVLAYLFYPLEQRLRRTIRSPAVRAGLLTLAALLVITVPVVYTAQAITRELSSAFQVQRAQRLVANAQLWLERHEAEIMAEWIRTGVARGQEFLLASIPNLFGSVFQIVLGIFVCLFVFYYFTKEGATIWDTFLNSLPLPAQLKTRVNDDVAGILRAIFFGQLLTAIAQGSIGGIGLMIFQVPQPFFWTVVMILVSFFPIVGSPVVWGPAAALKLMAGQTWQGIGLLIYGAVLVMQVDNFLRPRLIAMHSQVHPVVILIGIIGGTQVFGFIGFLVGPVIFAIFLQLLRFFAEVQPTEQAPASQDQSAERQPAPTSL